MTAHPHQQAGQAFDYALYTGGSEAWLTANTIWQDVLTEEERVSLAFATLLGLDGDTCEQVNSAAACSKHVPMAPLLSAMDEASHWADCADYPSIKACTLAGYDRMTGPDQVAFLDYVSGRPAA